MLNTSTARDGSGARFLVGYLVLSIISLGGPPPASADYLGTKINRIFVDPDSISVVADGYDLGDEIGYILETTPDQASGSNEGHAAWLTLYVPPGSEVIGASFVKQNGDGTYSDINAKQVDSTYDGWGVRGAFGYGPQDGTVWLDEGYINEIQQDTGIFYSTDARTALHVTGYDSPLDGVGAGDVDGIPDCLGPTGVGLQTIYNQWDFEQVLAFGLTPPAGMGGMGVDACTGVVLADVAVPSGLPINGGMGNAPVISVDSGLSWKGTGSIVAGPFTYYTNHFNVDGELGLECTIVAPTMGTPGEMAFARDAQCVGPWQRIAYADSKIGASGAVSPAFEDGAISAPTNVDDATGHALSSANPLPGATNAVRWVMGIRRIGDIELARIRLRITNAALFIASFGPVDVGTFCLDSTGGDTGDIAGKDVPWRYYEPVHACFDGSADALLFKQVTHVNGVASAGTSVRPDDIISYKIEFTNTSGGVLDDIFLTDVGGTNLALVDELAETDCAHPSYDGDQPGSTPDYVTHPGIWAELDGLPAAATVTVYMCGKVDAGAAEGADVINDSAVSWGTGNMLTSRALSLVGGRIEGTVYNDEDAVGSRGDLTMPHPGTDVELFNVTVKLWSDEDGSGTVNTGDILIETQTTGSDGTFSFENPGTGTYIVAADVFPACDFMSGDKDTVPVPPEQCTAAGDSAPPLGDKICREIDVGAYTVGDVSLDNDFFMVCSITLPVTLSSFESSGSGIVQWTTATEVGNAGFNLYASTPNGRRLLNRTPVRSKVLSSTSPQSYRIRLSGIGDGGQLWLEDLDLLGKRELKGPFEVGRHYGDPDVRAGDKELAPKIDWGAIRTEHMAKRARVRKANRVVSNRNLRMKLLVSEDGIHRVTFEELRDAGLDLSGVTSDEISLSNRGRVVARFIGGGSVFGPGSFLEFYGYALDTLYTKDNVYYVHANAALALPMTVQTKLPNTGLTPETYYIEKRSLDRNLKYDFSAPNGDPWYDKLLIAFDSPVSARFDIEIDDYVDGAAPVSLRVETWGATSWPDVKFDHHVVLRFNGHRVANKKFDGQKEFTVKTTLPGGLLQEGRNRLLMKLVGDTGAPWDVTMFDSMKVKYPRAFVARENRLRFKAAGRLFRVENLATENVVAYRLRGRRPTRLTPTVEESPFSASEPSTTYRAFLRGRFDKAKEYAVSSVEGLRSPRLEPEVSAGGLKVGRAEYLVISHGDFAGELDDLVALRESEGWDVRVVDVAAVYREYSFGVVDPVAIRKYVRFASRRLGTRMVLLVGGDSYDYHDYLGLGSISFLPSLYVQTGDIVRFAPADPLFTDVDGDGLPNLPIGRLPVRTSAELRAVIDKIVTYAESPLGATGVFAADSFDGAGESFEATSNRFISELGSGWDIRRAYVGGPGGVSSARNALLDSINEGVALTSFFGHSGPSVWTFQGLFSATDAQTLSNQGVPTVVTQWGCWNTYYVDPDLDTMAHRLMLSGEQGAAAVLGASTLTQASSDRALGRLLMPRLAKPGVPIGTALQAAKEALATTDPELLDVLLGWTLLGDPGIIVRP